MTASLSTNESLADELSTDDDAYEDCEQSSLTANITIDHRSHNDTDISQSLTAECDSEPVLLLQSPLAHYLQQHQVDGDIRIESAQPFNDSSHDDGTSTKDQRDSDWQIRRPSSLATRVRRFLLLCAGYYDSDEGDECEAQSEWQLTLPLLFYAVILIASCLESIVHLVRLTLAPPDAVALLSVAGLQLTAMTVIAMLSAYSTYMYYHRLIQYRTKVRCQSLLSSLSAAARSLSLHAQRAVSLIGEVELVSRGYLLSGRIYRIHAIEANQFRHSDRDSKQLKQRPLRAAVSEALTVATELTQELIVVASSSVSEDYFAFNHSLQSLLSACPPDDEPQTVPLLVKLKSQRQHFVTIAAQLQSILAKSVNGSSDRHRQDYRVLEAVMTVALDRWKRATRRIEWAVVLDVPSVATVNSDASSVTTLAANANLLLRALVTIGDDLQSIQASIRLHREHWSNFVTTNTATCTDSGGNDGSIDSTTGATLLNDLQYIREVTQIHLAQACQQIEHLIHTHRSTASDGDQSVTERKERIDRTAMECYGDGEGDDSDNDRVVIATGKLSTDALSAILEAQRIGQSQPRSFEGSGEFRTRDTRYDDDSDEEVSGALSKPLGNTNASSKSTGPSPMMATLTMISELKSVLRHRSNV